MKLPQTFNLQEGESDTLVTYDCVSLPKKFVIKNCQQCAATIVQQQI